MMSPHLKGGHNSPTAARYATISGPLTPPSSLLVPPGPRQQTQSPMIMLKPRGPVPLWGDSDGPLMAGTWAQVRRKTYYFFSDKVSMSPPLSHPQIGLFL
jgi:hypothetical protein